MNEQTDANAAADSLTRRKERLEALKARRGGQAAASKDLGAVFSENPARRPAAGPKQGPGRRDKKGQRKVLVKLHNVLSKTEQDERGYVEGTQFTVAGVERLMGFLTQRAGAEDKPGKKAAVAALRFLNGSDDGDRHVAGASVTRLQQLSQRFDKAKNRRRGGRQGQ